MRHAGDRENWPRIAFAGAVALHVVMLASLWGGYFDLFHDTDRYPRGIDFYSVYQAGDALLHGRSIYDWPAPPGVVPISFPFRYLPFVAYAIAAPLNAFSPERAYWIWVVAIEGMLAVSARLAYRLAPEPAWGWIAAAMWFAFTPLYLELYMGQFSFLMALLMLWTATLVLGARENVAAAPWAASLVVKTNSALLGPVLLRLRQWRALAAGAIALVVLNAPYFAFRPGDGRRFWDINFSDYWETPENQLRSVNSGDLGLSSFVRSVWLAFDDGAADTPGWLTLVIVLGILSIAVFATFRGRARPDVLFALWLSTYFLVYSDVWEHHYVMLLPALAIVVARRPDLRILALAVFVMVALPTPYWLFERFLSDRPPDARLVAPEFFWPLWARITYHASKAVPVLLLWGALAQTSVAHDVSRRP